MNTATVPSSRRIKSGQYNYPSPALSIKAPDKHSINDTDDITSFNNNECIYTGANKLSCKCGVHQRQNKKIFVIKKFMRSILRFRKI